MFYYYNKHYSKTPQQRKILKSELASLVQQLTHTRTLQNIFENKRPIKHRYCENLIGLLIFEVSKSSAVAVNFEIFIV